MHARFFCSLLAVITVPAMAENLTESQRKAAEWRTAHRTIDLHQHLDYKPELLARAIKIMDAAGVGIGVDLTPGTVTPGPNGEPSEFEQHKKMEDTQHPGRW